MAKLMIQYSKYTDYDRLEKLNWVFDNPIKEGHIYIAKLKRPIYMLLPKSEILEIYEEPTTQVKRLKYIIDTKRHNDLISFFDNMDSLCVELANVNSITWFKRTIEKKKLVELYNRIYDEDDEKDEEGIYNTTCELELSNMNLLNDLMNYNDEDSMNIMICINGIEFYKQSFQWNIKIDKIIEETIMMSDKDDTDDDEDVSQDESDEENGYISPDEGEVANKLSIKNNKEEDLIDELTKDDKEQNITNEMMKNFAISQPESIRKTNNKEDIKSNMELESIISQKSEDIRRYLLNAERARRMADMMHQKAKYLSEEMKIHQTQLKQRGL